MRAGKEGIGLKVRLFHLVILVAILLGLWLGWSRAAYGDTGMEVSYYTGVLFFPEQIGGVGCANVDKLVAGMKLEFSQGPLGLEVDLLSGLTAIEDYDYYYGGPFYSDLPLIFSLNLLLYPLPTEVFRPYVSAGCSGTIIWLELDDPDLTDDYTLWAWNLGLGLRFVFDDGNYFFTEYRRICFRGDDALADFDLRLYTVGFSYAF